MAHEYELDTYSDELDWSDTKANLAADLAALFEAEQVTALLIWATGLGWQRSDAVAAIEAEAEALFEALFLDRADFRLVFKLGERKDGFNVIRYSHDEPTGATFNVEFANRCDDCSTVPCQCDNCEDCGWPLYEDVEHYCTRA